MGESWSHIGEAERQLVVGGHFKDAAAANAAVRAFCDENRIPIDDEGYLSNLNYMDVVHELSSGGAQC